MAFEGRGGWGGWGGDEGGQRQTKGMGAARERVERVNTKETGGARRKGDGERGKGKGRSDEEEQSE